MWVTVEWLGKICVLTLHLVSATSIMDSTIFLRLQYIMTRDSGMTELNIILGYKGLQPNTTQTLIGPAWFKTPVARRLGIKHLVFGQ